MIQIEDKIVGKKYKPDIEFCFAIAYPEKTNKCGYALLMEHDGLNMANVNSMFKLAEEGNAPYCVSIGVTAGQITAKDGKVRGMRMNSYDLFDKEYGDFLVYELIPYVEKKYGLNISKSPDMHFISGGSSGGISAFTVAWFHSNYFHRVYMSSPSFLAMGRGNEIPYLIRKYETKPLRVYEEYSENEPNDYFGWSKSIDMECEKALEFAGYDYTCEVFQGEGHCSRYWDESEAYKRNRWIWNNWKDDKIVAKRNSPRVEKVVSMDSIWEVADSFPAKERTSFMQEIYKNAVKSNDGQFWYTGNKDDDIIYAFLNNADIIKEEGLLHATLHSVPRIYPKGCIDLAVDKTDRLFVLTAIGIQTVRSFGLVDVILNLPDDGLPLEIAITDALYVKTDKGIYKRSLTEECIKETSVKRKYVEYYD